jgi:DNA-binding response OmpR family regulator
MRRLRILVVEDDAFISALIAEVLTDLGYEICGTAGTELAAIAAAVRLSPDIMIVDIGLPHGDGVSAMHEILRLTEMPHIFMTGGARRALPANATVLLKPFGLISLIAALESVVWQAMALEGSAHSRN